MELTQKNKLYILSGILVILVIATIILCINIFKSPANDTSYNINSSYYPVLNISSELVDNKLNGYTVIKSDNNDFKVTGTFENGVFKEGNISLKNNNIEYYLDGSFENFNLKDGKMTIITEDKIIIKSGLFIDNKLDGTGSIKIEDKNTGEVLFHYAGKFENDKPIY